MPDCDGNIDGEAVGWVLTVGLCVEVGCCVYVGLTVLVGLSDGDNDGSFVGTFVCVGEMDGSVVGLADCEGDIEGASVGWVLTVGLNCSREKMISIFHDENIWIIICNDKRVQGKVHTTYLLLDYL